MNETDQILDQFRRVLARRKMLIAACVVVVLVPVIVLNEKMAPTYQAEASLVFDEFTRPVPTYSSNYSQEVETTNRIQELGSRSFAAEIAAALTPEERSRFRFPDEKPPGFDEMDYITGVIHRSLSASAVRKSSLVRITAQLHDPELCARIVNVAAEAYQARHHRIKQEGVRGIRVFVEQQLERFRTQLHESEQALREYKEESGISSFKDQEQEILRRLTEAEVLYNASATNRESLEKRLNTIEENIAQTREELVPSIIAVATPRMERLQQRLVDLQLQYAELQVQGYPTTHPKLTEIESDISMVKERLSAEAHTLAASDDLVDPLGQIAKYGEERLELQIDIEALRAREEALQRVIRSYERTLSRLPEKELNLARLTRERDVNQKIYNSLLEKLEETKISEAENLPNIRIVDLATPDYAPIRPRKRTNLALGLLLGLIAGTGIAFVREAMTTSVESHREVEEATGWPALASIPRIERLPAGELHLKRHGPLTPRQLRNHKRSLIATLAPDGGPSEGYRMLRTNLTFRGVGSDLRTIAVTSSAPDDGKSTIVSNLAISFATLGERVLVIDAEVRRAGMHILFDTSDTPGFRDLLDAPDLGLKDAGTRGERALGFAQRRRPSPAADSISEDLSERTTAPLSPALEGAIHSTFLDKLKLMPGGSAVQNPGDFLASRAERLREVLEEVRRSFDVILIDTPPLAVVHDTAVVSGLVDGILFVVSSRRMDRELLARSRVVLERAGANVLGAVLNAVEPTRTYKTAEYYHEGT